MSLSNDTTETLAINNTSLLTVNMTNVYKLTATNYLMWSLKVHALLDGYALSGYLDGSVLVPAANVTRDGQTSINPDNTVWKRQDKLIYSALLGAISLTIQPLVSRANTSAEVWNTLAMTYAKPSRGHIKQLKAQLKNWTKGTRSINEYIQGLTTRLDTLAILGKPVDHEDQIDMILEGLPDDYKSVVDQVEGRDSAPTITDLHERLLNHEAKLQALVSSSPLPATANVAQQRNNNANNNYYSRQSQQKARNNNNNRPWQPQPQPTHNKNESRRPYLGRCQLCNVQGHSAKWCPQLQTHTQGSSHGPSSPFTPWQPRANLTMASPYNANN